MQQYSKVYAQALYEIAAEDGQEQQLLDEITEVGRLMDETPELREVMTSPAFSNEERIDIINSVFGSQACTTMVNFLCVLCEEGRAGSVAEITEAFRDLYNEAHGIAEATVTTAVPLDAAARERLKSKLESGSSKRVIMTEKVDPSIIGGVIVRIGDKLIDGSVRSKLSRANTDIGS